MMRKRFHRLPSLRQAPTRLGGYGTISRNQSPRFKPAYHGSSRRLFEMARSTLIRHPVAGASIALLAGVAVGMGVLKWLRGEASR